jgi:MFS family permease
VAGPGGFTRTPRTWLAYGALATFAYVLYGLGPVLAFLHAELHLSYLLTSLHSTLWSAGSLLASVAYPPLAGRFGRGAVFWAGTACSAAAALLFAAGYRLPVTLAAAALFGTAGTLVLAGTTAIMTDEHGPLRDRALIEANVGASGSAVLAPAVIGGLAAAGAGWRAGMIVPALAFGALWLRFRRVPLAPARPQDPAAPAGPAGPARLPGLFWVRAALLGVVSGMEFCLVFQAALLLHAHAGLTTGRAASALSAFYVGELAGRAGGSVLTRRVRRTWIIIAGALAVTAAGFAGFWLSRQPALAVTGLGVAGLGVANLYPLSLARAVSAAPGRADHAAGRAQLAVGVSALILPFMLGTLADRIGVTAAYLIEPALIAAAAALLVAGQRRPAPARVASASARAGRRV